MSGYWIETLGCAKNTVDSDRIAASFEARGVLEASSPEEAGTVVVNTCAFIDAAREESIAAILDLADRRKRGSKLIVTGCMAERYGQELADALSEVDHVAGFNVDIGVVSTVKLGKTISRRRLLRAEDESVPAMDLLNYRGRGNRASYSYIKVAEGCNRHCGFCVIPQFRGRQVSREFDSILAEVERLGSPEIVLIAQDLASYGIDSDGRRRLAELYREVALRAPWVRLLYLYPSGVTSELLEAICDSAVPYVDLSLQHVSGSLLRRMRRVGSPERIMARIAEIRSLAPEAALRSSFIVGYPGETREDQQLLLDFLEEAQLDWVGFFPFSPEEGSYAVGLENEVPRSLALERLNEASDAQERILRVRQADQIGTTLMVLADEPLSGRSYREAPEIDGVIHFDREVPVGTFVDVEITDAAGPDLTGRVVPVPARKLG